MRVGVLGATGFIGRRLVEALVARGDAVTVFSRDAARAQRSFGDRVAARGLDAVTGAAFASLDAVVNLAGEPVAGGRWTAAHKRAVRESRVATTRQVVAALEAASPRPRALVNASAVGYYGSRGDEAVDEATPAGDGFLADVCRQWEAEAVRAEALGVRVVRLRIGIVLGDAGGALAQMAAPFKLFAGGPIGSGRQYVPWIHVDDVVGLLVFALDREALRGAVNATAPQPVRSKEFAAALGRAMGRPSWLAVPGFALRVVVGEMADALLAGQRAVPRAAEAAGYGFRYTQVEEALRAALR